MPRGVQCEFHLISLLFVANLFVSSNKNMNTRRTRHTTHKDQNKVSEDNMFHWHQPGVINCDLIIGFLICIDHF